MRINTTPLNRFSHKTLKLLALLALQATLISIPCLAIALSTVKLTLDDGEMDEANQGTGMFTVTRSSNGKLDENLVVRFNFGGNAANGSDYTVTDQQFIGGVTRALTIPAGSLSKSSLVTPVKDFIIEGDETITWTLIPDSRTYTVGIDILAEMTIADLVNLIFKDSFEEPDP